MMKIPLQEQLAVCTVLRLGSSFGYDVMIKHLETAWAKRLMDDHGMDEKKARKYTGGDGYPFLLQSDFIERGEWDETGKRYLH